MKSARGYTDSQIKLPPEAAWGRGTTEEGGKEKIRCLRDKE